MIGDAASKGTPRAPKEETFRERRKRERELETDPAKATKKTISLKMNVIPKVASSLASPLPGQNTLACSSRCRHLCMVCQVLVCMPLVCCFSIDFPSTEHILYHRIAILLVCIVAQTPQLDRKLRLCSSCACLITSLTLAIMEFAFNACVVCKLNNSMQNVFDTEQYAWWAGRCLCWSGHGGTPGAERAMYTICCLTCPAMWMAVSGLLKTRLMFSSFWP